ncbi:hypothetical protein [Brucella gallinifaecis]|uniref:hypothetical protein n=1 Tax=Brucella gallinifaecis TaxID=215590 RepID=UPI00235FF042|nr:hypothetical protein [Brucella gallinifaecis]
MTISDIIEPELDDEDFSDEMKLFLEILAHPDFDKTEFNNSLCELEIEPDEELTNRVDRLQ